MSETAELEAECQRSHGIDHRLFLFMLLLLVGGAILRSALATGLDDFHSDEAYHIAAGVSYVRYGDFRLNPEHPPLVKLWAGSLISLTGFRLREFRPFHDKADERAFTQENVYLYNDPDSVQRRARIAMWTLNGLLLIGLAFAVRKVFGAGVALGAILFLAVDPTVATHLPMVLTDLPVSLLASTAVLFATGAFKSWGWGDLIPCSIALGLTFGTKHSGIVFYGLLALAGLVLAVVGAPGKPAYSRVRQIGKVTVVLLGALAILWSLYLFRFTESPEAREVFNLPLADKIADLHSPVQRFVLREMAATHVLPRAYIWGLADTIRAGIQGRVSSELAFGQPYYERGPTYFFPALIGLKLPIGLSLLVLLAVVQFLRRQLPRQWDMPIAGVLGVSFAFFFVLIHGSTYGGIRHALPVVVLFAILGGMGIQVGFATVSRPLKIGLALALLAAMVSALPVSRPYEYYNELVGRRNAHLYFGGEQIDLGQRGKELARYYHDQLQPAGEIPYFSYAMSLQERQARGLDWIGRDLERDEARMVSPVWSGTILITSGLLGKRLWWDTPSLRAAVPIARFGSLFVFRGSFPVPGLAASIAYRTAIRKIYAEKPDLVAAEELLSKSAKLDPGAFFVNIELGNVCLNRGRREDALDAYAAALQHAPDDSALRSLIESQIKRVSLEPLDRIPTLRNPALE